MLRFNQTINQLACGITLLIAFGISAVLGGVYGSVSVAESILYDINNPYGFRDWDWGEFKLHTDLDLEERINQFEILKDHKEELRKSRENGIKIKE